MKATIPPSAKLVFSGQIFDVYQWEQELFDGTKKTFERLKRVDTASILAIVDGKVILQEQEQPNLGSFLSLPGGMLDSYEEDPLVAAQRELLEETGYSSTDWVLWFRQSPLSKIAWTLHTYFALDCKKTAELHLDAGERIKNTLVSPKEFMQIATENDRFRNTDVSFELLKLRLNQEKLEAFWKGLRCTL
jgi:ADP-ribose pyrophosphatase